MQNISRYSLGTSPAGGGYDPLAAGTKYYGGGRSFPTSGPVDPMGYIERDAAHARQRQALLNRLQANLRGDKFAVDGSQGVR